MNREVSAGGQSSCVGSDDGGADELPSFWEAYRTLAQSYQAEIARCLAILRKHLPHFVGNL